MANPNQEQVSKFPQIFWGMVAIAIAVTSGSIIGGSALRSLRASDSLTIIGSAKRPIRSDYVVWRSSVSTQQPTLQQAFQEIKRQSDRVRTYLRAQNISDESTSLSSISTESIP